MIDGGCGKCGVEIRAGSLFCYNCGKSVAASVSDASLDTRLTDVHEKLKGPTRSTLRNDPIERNGLSGGAAIGSVSAAPGQPLKKRKRPVRAKRGPVDVVWQADDGPATAYLVVAIGIALLVAILLATAYYMK